MAEIQPGRALVEKSGQPLAECDRAIEKIRNGRREANDLDLALDLMRGILVAAEDVEEAAAGKLEKSAREAIDVDRRAFPGWKTIKGRVKRPCFDCRHVFRGRDRITLLLRNLMLAGAGRARRILPCLDPRVSCEHRPDQLTGRGNPSRFHRLHACDT